MSVIVNVPSGPPTASLPHQNVQLSPRGPLYYGIEKLCKQYRCQRTIRLAPQLACLQNELDTTLTSDIELLCECSVESHIACLQNELDTTSTSL